MSWVEKTIQRSVDKELEMVVRNIDTELEKFARNMQVEWQKIANEIIKYFYCIMTLR